MDRNIGGFRFVRVGALQLKRDSHDGIVEYTHHLPPDAKPNRYAAGPFCFFELREASHVAGVYVLMVGNDVKYVGECENLQRRFGPMGYGSIAPRNCHGDGQSTNCKINSLVLQIYKAGKSVNVWFYPSVSERKSIESRLLSELSPPWNGSRPYLLTGRIKSSGVGVSRRTPNKNRFREALDTAFAHAERLGKCSIEVRAGDLHRQVSGYPGPTHQMPQCCRSMKAAMVSGDRIVESPPKGAGANLVIEYRLPRGLLSNHALESTVQVVRQTRTAGE